MVDFYPSEENIRSVEDIVLLVEKDQKEYMELRADDSDNYDFWDGKVDATKVVLGYLMKIAKPKKVKGDNNPEGAFA